MSLTREDVEKLCDRLQSTGAKARKEALRELRSYLDDAGGVSLVPLLDAESVDLLNKTRRFPTCSWPGLAHVLCEAIKKELDAAKKRGPEVGLAKVFRLFVQKAEGRSQPGNPTLYLWRRARALFLHIATVLKNHGDLAAFALDYGAVLRSLLEVKEYAQQLGFSTYDELLKLHLDKARGVANGKLAKSEESFRSIRTLVQLLQQSQLSHSKDSNAAVLDAFCHIFVHLSDDGRFAHRLLNGLNSFLLTNGLDLGNDVVTLYSATRDFVVRTWLTTRDSKVKDALVTYARIQLQLRGFQDSTDDDPSADQSPLEQLAELITRELDQSAGVAGSTWAVVVTSLKQHSVSHSRQTLSLLELAASIFQRVAALENAGTDGLCEGEPAKKRRRTVPLYETICEKAIAGEGLWPGALCRLVNFYHNEVPAEVLLSWLRAFSNGLQKVLAEGSSARAADLPIWTLRCLRELASAWREGCSSGPCQVGQTSQDPGVTPYIEAASKLWQTVWQDVLHWLPLLGNKSLLVGEALLLLQTIATKGLTPDITVAQEVFELRTFSDPPTSSALSFVSAIFCDQRLQVQDLSPQSFVDLRRRLLKWTMTAVHQSYAKSKTGKVWHGGDADPASVARNILSLTLRTLPFGVALHEHGLWTQPTDEIASFEQDLEALDRAPQALAQLGESSQPERAWERPPQASSLSSVRSVSKGWLEWTASALVEEVLQALEREQQQSSLVKLLQACTVLAHCIGEVQNMTASNLHVTLPAWEPSGSVWKALAQAVKASAALLEGSASSTGPGFDDRISRAPILDDDMDQERVSKQALAPHAFDADLVEAVKAFVSSPGTGPLVGSEGAEQQGQEVLLVKLFEVALRNYEAALIVQEPGSAAAPGQPAVVGLTKAAILDEDLDGEVTLTAALVQETVGAADRASTPGSARAIGPSTVFPKGWHLSCMGIMAAIGVRLPSLAVSGLVKVLRNEKDSALRMEILLSLCSLLEESTVSCLPNVVTQLEDMAEELAVSEERRLQALQCITRLAASLAGAGVVLEEAPVVKVWDGSQWLGFKAKHPEVGRVEVQLPLVSRIVDMVQRIAQNGLQTWQSRAQQAGATVALIWLSPSAIEPLMDPFLAQLRDPVYRVRQHVGRLVPVLFETWDGHEELLDSVRRFMGATFPFASRDKLVLAAEAAKAEDGPSVMAETAIATLGRIAAASALVEADAVFMMAAYSALHTCHLPLLAAVLERLRVELGYPDQWKLMAQHLEGVLFRWVRAGVSLQSLVNVGELLLPGFQDAPVHLLTQCAGTLLAPLFLAGDISEMQVLARLCEQPLTDLVRENFAPVFAALLPIFCGGTEVEKKAAQAALQGSMLGAMEVTERQRDEMIRKKASKIVHELLMLVGEGPSTQLPRHLPAVIGQAIHMVVFEMSRSQGNQGEQGLVDRFQILRADRVFTQLLRLHNQIKETCSPRHKQHLLGAIEVLIEALDENMAIPSTFQYLVNILLQSLSIPELQAQCCALIDLALNKIEGVEQEDEVDVKGRSLLVIVPKLVECYTEAVQKGHKTKATLLNFDCEMESSSSPNMKHRLGSPEKLLSLLRRLTVEAPEDLHPYIAKLDPFPSLPEFEEVIALHNKLHAGIPLAANFVHFVERAQHLPPGVRRRSIRNLQEQLISRRAELYQRGEEQDSKCHPDVVVAAWQLVRLCDKLEDAQMREVAAQFLAAVGISDPLAVAFRLPALQSCESGRRGCSARLDQDGCRERVSVDPVGGVDSRVVMAILFELLVDLVHSDVSTIALAAETLKGLLATEKGYRAMQALPLSSRKALEVHAPSRGPNPERVADMLGKLKEKSSQESCVVLEDSLLWACPNKGGYENWVSKLMHSLSAYCNDEVLQLCQAMVLCRAPLAELLFPHVLGNLAAHHQADSDVCRTISRQLNDNLLGDPSSSIRAVQLVLDTLNCLRRCHVEACMTTHARGASQRQRGSNSAGGTSASAAGSRRGSASMNGHSQGDTPDADSLGPLAWEMVYWLQIEYLVVAKAAQRCSAPFTSLLYIEHWCESDLGGFSLGDMSFQQEDQASKHEQLLLDAYSSLNEPDGIYGVARTHKLSSQLRLFEHEAKWDHALETYDFLLQDSRSRAADDSANLGVLDSLQKMGCLQVVDTYWHGLSQQKQGLQHKSAFQELRHEAAWKLGKWQVSEGQLVAEEVGDREDALGYHAAVYSCLQSLIRNDREVFMRVLGNARQQIVKDISHASAESAQNVNPAVVKLQVLEGLSRAWTACWPAEQQSDQLGELESFWSAQLGQVQGQYDLSEPLLAARGAVLRALGREDRLPKHLLEAGRRARKAGRLNHANSALHELKLMVSRLVKEQIGTGTSAASYGVLGQVEEAKVLWQQGQKDMAVNYLTFLLNSTRVAETQEQASLLCLAGKWRAETRTAGSRVILEQYLEEGAKRSLKQPQGEPSSSATWKERACRANFRLAHYADSLFRGCEARVQSAEYQAAGRLRQHKQGELQALRARLKNTGLKAEDKRAYSMKGAELEKQLGMELGEEERFQLDREKYLLLGLRSYRYCLRMGNRYDMRAVFRVVSLWFNMHLSYPGVNGQMKETLLKVRSQKFLPLVYQMASRLGSASSSTPAAGDFQTVLYQLLLKITSEHPYHSIFVLLALANGDRVKDRQRNKHVFIVDLEKIQAAKALLASLSKQQRPLLDQARRLVDAYIQIAEKEVSQQEQNRTLTGLLPPTARRLKELDLMPVITAPLPVDPSCQYTPGSFPHFCGFSDSIKVMNGINAPKLIECFGSDGKSYKQLAKSGNDDLRQDAVMEQLFELVNTLLQDHPSTRKRRLHIRTYKVIPFTPSAGVLEWVDGTVPLGEYLLGSTRSGGAHGRYGGKDWTFLKCREVMVSVTDKWAAFQSVLQNFRPVFHHFFLERFPQPPEWFEKRLAYTRSVAASSMVGYIIGLGDRHSMNILVDEASADVVHIDLGVAFEQGLMLKTPERVPFRLTRELVCGMGVCGVEGVFRRCCEETLAVMRANKESLLTIIEVFIHDPLYKWALSPLKALQRQRDELPVLEDAEAGTGLGGPLDVDVAGNKDAARALLRVKEKLDGYEDGEIRSLQGQVQQLIQDAQDPERLCSMFPGWGAWL